MPYFKATGEHQDHTCWPVIQSYPTSRYCPHISETPFFAESEISFVSIRLRCWSSLDITDLDLLAYWLQWLDFVRSAIGRQSQYWCPIVMMLWASGILVSARDQWCLEKMGDRGTVATWIPRRLNSIKSWGLHLWCCVSQRLFAAEQRRELSDVVPKTRPLYGKCNGPDTRDELGLQ